MKTQEFNFDGIVGPTHNYAGLSYGNVASSTHQSKTSHPRAAALQGLSKMKFVRDLGIGQCVLPPLPRPNIKLLRDFGFAGSSDIEIIQSAHRQFPTVLAACYSASNMWTANASTVSPGMDCMDGRLHLTPANLSSKLHRSIEAAETTSNLRSIFSDPKHFVVHDPLPTAAAMSDEGAANHLRLCPEHGTEGLEIFVWGRSEFAKNVASSPRKFPARQTLESFQAIALRHGLSESSAVFLQQHPDAIDGGVFHNDVISVANENVVLAHELAFADREKTVSMLKQKYVERFGDPLQYVEFSTNELSLEETVRSYLFNSQLVTRPDGGMTLICPLETSEIESAKRCTDRLLSESNRVDSIEFLDLRQSMNNGGGPACLRLRIVLTAEQQSAMHSGIVLTDELYEKLVAHVEAHYRADLHPNDLLDPKLLDEARTAHEAMTHLLGLSPTSLNVNQ